MKNFLIASVVIFLILLGVFIIYAYNKKDVNEVSLEEDDDINNDEENIEKEDKRTFVKVKEVIDGDTLAVYINGDRELIRLIGVSAPESPENTHRKKECFGKEASDFAKKELNGQNIYLESDDTQGNKDRYHRLLRYVFLEDGTNFNELIIREGYAHEYTYDLPYKYQKSLKEAEKEAKKGKKGLWAENECED